jgi:hypothetical protein
LAETARPPRRQRSSATALDTFEIGAFRGLRGVRLENLGRINLLVGSNNAGKTSVLEALAVSENAFDPGEWFNVVRAREIRSSIVPDQMSTLEALHWMFPMREDDHWGESAPLPIWLASEARGETDAIEITCEPFSGILEPEQMRRSFGLSRLRNNNEPVEDTGLLLRASASLQRGMAGTEYHSQEWQIWSQLGIRSAPRRISGQTNVVFLAPYAHRNSPANLRRLSEASRMGVRDDIDALLRELDPRIEGVEIITSEDGRIPKIAVRLRSGALVPQGVLGDGIRRALSISLALRAAADGMLLVDEIEAALHVSALDRMFRWLEEAVKTFSVQVFATTHSLEAIESIIRSAEPASHAQMSAYMLDSDQTGGVKRFTGGMLHRLVHQRGLDIRG